VHISTTLSVDRLVTDSTAHISGGVSTRITPSYPVLKGRTYTYISSFPQSYPHSPSRLSTSRTRVLEGNSHLCQSGTYRANGPPTSVSWKEHSITHQHG